MNTGVYLYPEIQAMKEGPSKEIMNDLCYFHQFIGFGIDDQIKRGHMNAISAHECLSRWNSMCNRIKKEVA